MIQESANLVVTAQPARPAALHAVKPAARAAARASLANVWRDALSTFGRQSAPLLTCAFVGFALPAIVSALVGAVLVMQMYANAGTVFVSFGPNRTVPIVVEAVLGTLAASFARGAITALALHQGSTPGNLRSAMRAALTRWPMLLLAATGAGGVLFLGSLGLDALLREFRVDLSDISQLSLTLDGLTQSIILRTIGGLLPDPGAPFTQWITLIRLEMSRVSASLIYMGGLSYYRLRTIQEASAPWAFGCAGLLLLTAGDSLLRFVIPGVMRAPAGLNVRALAQAVGLAGRQLGLVMAHTWAVRLVLYVVNTLFLTIPLVMVQSLLTPYMIGITGNAWLYIAVSVLAAISLSLVGMVFAAFAVIYDARLYEWVRKN